MSEVTPCLWFDGQAEEATSFYVSLLPNSRIDHVAPGPGGKAMMVSFTLAGRPFQALNGGPQYRFSEAISMLIKVEGQAEVDRLWDALTADGGEPGQCAWLKDRWGLSWQIVPTALGRLLGHPDRGAAERAMQATLTMGKIEIAALEAAAAAKEPAMAAN